MLCLGVCSATNVSGYKMGKGSASVPTPPDPTKTAAAQTASNEQTALYQAGLNNVNQITPYGNLTYSLGSTGGSSPTYDYDSYNKALSAYNASGASSTPATNPYSPLQGNYYAWNSQHEGDSSTNQGTAPQLSDYQTNAGSQGTPQYTSTISLSPQEQAIFDQQMKNQAQAGGAANTALSQYQSASSSPIDYSKFMAIPGASDIMGQQQTAMDAQNTLLAPQLAQQQAALESKLANQGLAPGTEAYKNAYNNFNNLQSQTLANETLNSGQYAQMQNQIALSNRNQQIAEAEAQRNDPLNQYQALMGGSQVTNPTFSNPGNTQVAGTNVAQLAEQQYQAQLAAYNAQNQSSNSLTGSIFGLGGSFLGGPGFSSLLGSAGGDAGDAAFMAMFA